MFLIRLLDHITTLPGWNSTTCLVLAQNEIGTVVFYKFIANGRVAYYDRKKHGIPDFLLSSSIKIHPCDAESKMLSLIIFPSEITARPFKAVFLRIVMTVE